MIYYSNCKINIGLNVIDRYSNGYHSLSTIFFPVNELRDAIEIFEISGSEVEFASNGIAIDCLSDANICIKAYNLIKEFHNIPSVSIILYKSVPIGAGLGGGSANGITVMRALNDMFELSISDDTMLSLAKRLGSDTSFFVINKPCYANCLGDNLSIIDLSLKGYYLSLIKPNYSVSTSDAYKGIITKTPLFDLRDILSLDISQWQSEVVNDFEASIFTILPCLDAIKKKFYDLGAIYSSMSGSGSTIYAISSFPIDLSQFSGDVFCHQEQIRI